MSTINLEYIQQNGLIIYDVIYGSHAYGTAREDSDKDRRGIYVLPDFIMKPIETIDGFRDSEYYPEITDGTQDVVYYELRKFLYMLSNSKPNALEMLNIPDDCVLYKHQVMDLLFKNKDKFITKTCQYTFSDYVKKQLEKAQGLNKMQHWEQQRVERKTPMDFCYAVIGNQSKPLEQYLSEKRMDPKFCGLTKVPHARDLYALYYDSGAAMCFSELYDDVYRSNQLKWRKEKGFEIGKGYKGIQMDDSNDIRLSSIPKFEVANCQVFYSKDLYSMHCSDYIKYQDWLKNRNESRYTDFESHGQGLDGKNMLHCRRLLDMCEEIAMGKGIIIRRENAKELLKIRTGEVSLPELVLYAEDKLEKIKILFNQSNLPNKIEVELINGLLIEMRNSFNASFFNLEKREFNFSC